MMEVSKDFYFLIDKFNQPSGPAYKAEKVEIYCFIKMFK